MAPAAACAANHLGPFPTGLVGLKAVRTVDQDWGECLRLVGVRMGGIRGEVGDQAGTPGIILTFLGPRAEFLVLHPGQPESETATPENDAARKLVAQAQAIRPSCPGKPSGTLPPAFAGGP
jgi:hypothetical protein